MRKFTNSPDTVNAVVLVCPPSSHVELRRPDIMLGAMYGDYSLRIPFNPMLGRFANDEASYEFRPGEGMTMGLNKKKNTRLSAVISLHNWTIHTSADGMDPEHVPGVTVWENAYARAPMPRDLFRGAMDSWWTVEGEEQRLSFIGDRLLGLELAPATGPVRPSDLLWRFPTLLWWEFRWEPVWKVAHSALPNRRNKAEKATERYADALAKQEVMGTTYGLLNEIRSRLDSFIDSSWGENVVHWVSHLVAQSRDHVAIGVHGS